MGKSAAQHVTAFPARKLISTLNRKLAGELRLEFQEVLKRRRSVRCYSSRPVEEEKLKRVLELADLAPSAYNLQSYEMFVVRSKVKKEALSRAAFDQSFSKQNFIAEAPVCLVFCADPAKAGAKYGERGANLYSLQDATIAATFAMLAAVDQGLSCVWVGAFHDEQVAAIVGAPLLRPVAILPIGYAGFEPKATSRRDIDDIVHEVD
jgi:nitroreductase